jgi:nucleoside phosphorylase
MAANRTPILDPRNYQIAWIAPLHIEAEAALLMLDATHEGDFYTERGDDYIYFAGAINGHNVIIATFPADQEYGVGSAAALASQVKKRFPNLWFGLLVGVAAGLPNLDRVPPLDIRLGDVLVGVGDSGTAGLINYGLGKQTKDGFELIRHGYLARTIKIVGAAISALKLKDRHLNTQGKPPTFLQYYEHVRDKLDEDGTFADPGQEKDNLHRTVYDSSDPATGSELVERTKRPHNVRNRIWYGPIGSGDTLMRDAKKRDELRDKHEVIGLEMEAAGIGNIIPVGVIRGVCDYGDDQKNDIWQPYAAAMAAAYAKAVLYQIRVRPDRRGEDPGNIAEASGASVGLQPNQGSSFKS